MQRGRRQEENVKEEEIRKGEVEREEESKQKMVIEKGRANARRSEHRHWEWKG